MKFFDRGEADDFPLGSFDITEEFRALLVVNTQHGSCFLYCQLCPLAWPSSSLIGKFLNDLLKRSLYALDIILHALDITLHALDFAFDALYITLHALDISMKSINLGVDALDIPFDALHVFMKPRNSGFKLFL